MLLLDQLRTTSDAEFKVLAVLTGLFALQPGRAGQISMRDLARAASVSLRTVQYSIENLTARQLIAFTRATGPKPATITLLFLGIERFTVANFATVAEFTVANFATVADEIHRWGAQNLLQYGATVANFATVGDLFPQVTVANSATVDGATVANFATVSADELPAHLGAGPPAGARIENREVLDFDIDRGEKQPNEPPDENTILNHVFNAQPRDWEAAEIREAKRWVQGYQCDVGDKFGASKERNRNPPDDKITAQILTACGSLAKTINLIHTLKGRRKAPGDEYSWYVTTALNIFHGIAPKTTTQARARLKVARRPSPPAITGEQQPLIETGQQILDDVMKQRRAKGANG